MTKEQDFDSIEPMETIQASLDCSDWEKPMGERHKDALKVSFDRRLKLEFHGVKVTSHAGLSACGELDKTFGLTDMIAIYRLRPEFFVKMT